MANLIPLGRQYQGLKVLADATQEGTQLKETRDAFKQAFISHLKWGGRYEVQQLQQNNIDNKSIRKMNEWALQKERNEASAPILSRIFNVAWNIFTWFTSFLYLPSYQDQMTAFQAKYAEVHNSQEPGARTVQACRVAKHQFKNVFHQATPEQRDAYFATLQGMYSKGKYWQAKADSRANAAPAPNANQNANEAVGAGNENANEAVDAGNENANGAADQAQAQA